MTLAETVLRGRSAALVVRSADAVLSVRGPDRLAWLNGLVTCQLAGLPEGRAAYGLVVTKKGRVVSDLVVASAEGALWVVVPQASAGEVASTFEHHLVMEDVALAPAEVVAFFVHGPRAGEVRADGAMACALDLTGLGGAVVLAPRAREAEIAAALSRAAGAVGGAVGDEAAWEALRLEEGVPRFGRDFDETTYPQEASLEKRAVAFDKGCYLGQEVVCMLELRGHVKRKLVPVTLSGPAPAGAAVVDEAGGEAGRLTSVAFGPTRGAHVGLAMLSRACAEPGRTLRAGDAAVVVR